MDLIQKYLEIAKKAKESEDCNAAREEQSINGDYIDAVLRIFSGAKVVSGREVIKWKH